MHSATRYLAMSQNKTSGNRGEDAACEYLKKHGYKIIERNFRTRNGEIDIVAVDISEKEPVLAFIEVKTRLTEAFGTPFEAITSWKLQYLIRTATFYKQTHKNLPEAMRIDAVSVTNKAGEPQITLMKNVSE